MGTGPVVAGVSATGRIVLVTLDGETLVVRMAPDGTLSWSASGAVPAGCCPDPSPPGPCSPEAALDALAGAPGARMAAWAARVAAATAEGLSLTAAATAA